MYDSEKQSAFLPASVYGCQKMATAFMLQGLHMVAVRLVTKFPAFVKPENVLPKTEKNKRTSWSDNPS
jgi:hypothetical protein